MPLSETGVERITGFFFPVGLVVLAWFGIFVYPVWHICTACEPDLPYFLAWFGIILSLEPGIIFSHDLKGVCNTFLPNGFVNNVDHLWHDFKSIFVSAADRHAPIIQRHVRGIAEQRDQISHASAGLTPSCHYYYGQTVLGNWIFCWHLENLCSIPIFKKTRPQSTVQEFSSNKQLAVRVIINRACGGLSDSVSHD